MKMKVRVASSAQSFDASRIKLCFDLCCELAEALCQFLKKHGFRDLGDTRPHLDPRAGEASCDIDLDENRDLFETVTATIARLCDGGNLITAAENLYFGPLTDRSMVHPEARLPIVVRYAPDSGELLSYDSHRDEILTNHPAATEVAKECESAVRILSKACASRLIATLHIDDQEHRLPSPSATVFSHGSGPGTTAKTSAYITGILPTAKEAEAKLSGVRDNRVLRVLLTEKVLEAMAGRPFPVSCWVTYFEMESVVPLVSRGRERIVIADIGGITEQRKLDLD